MRNRLWNDWEVSDKIGEGRFASVYKAKKVVDGVAAYCAIKYVSISQTSQDIDDLVKKGIIKSKLEANNYYSFFIDGLRNEFEIMKGFVGSPYIVNCYDYFEEEKSDKTGIDIYIRMELVQDIDKYFENREIKVNDVVQMGIDICDALELCSSKGIIHKDIKPSNIFVGDDGKYKLGDFGISSSIHSINKEVLGTYNYMAPEVYDKKKVSFSTDLYSLGLVMYRLLNKNKLPFVSRSISSDEALKIRLSGMSLPSIRGVNKNLMKIILKSCSYDSSTRYIDATSMKKDLQSLSLTVKSNSNKNEKNLKNNSFDKTVSIYDPELDSDSKAIINDMRNVFSSFNSDNSKNKALKIILVIAILLLILLLLIRGCYFGKKCDAGYVNKNGKCVPGYYYCDEGYSLNEDNKCQKVIESVDARVSYSCKDDYILKDKTCYKNDTKDPVQSYQCADGFTLDGTKCVREESADAVVTYSCPNNYILNGTECVTVTNTAASKSYTCPDSSYKLSGSTCTKTESNGSWVTSKSTCPSGGSLQNGQCYASATCSYQYWGYCYGGYTCPSGYSLSGTSCYASPNVSKSCSQGTYSNGTCVKTTTTDATIKYTCPSGYTVVGDQCAKTSGIKATPKYICSDSTELRGSKCYGTVSTDAVLAYGCPDGYSFAGDVCVLQDKFDATVKYTCSKVYTLNGDKCEKYDIVSSKVHYNDEKTD